MRARPLPANDNLLPRSAFRTRQAGPRREQWLVGAELAAVYAVSLAITALYFAPLWLPLVR
jgi:hypothetical protein